MFQACRECPAFINEIRLQQQEGFVNAVTGTVQRIHAARIRKVWVVDQLNRLAVPGL